MPSLDRTSVQFGELRQLHEQVWPLVHASRYSELAPIVSRLIPELEHAARTIAPRAETARELLSDTYQAVAAMMAKVGETDAAWIAADRAVSTAETMRDPRAVAASLFRMAHTFLTLGQLDQAQAVANTVTRVLAKQTAQEPTSPETLSLYGAFHLVLAIAS